MEMKKVTVFVLAENSMGVPELLAYDFTVPKAKYDAGEHYDDAVGIAEADGYISIGVFDQFDMAGQQLMGSQPMYGDEPRLAGDIAKQLQRETAERADETSALAPGG